LAVYSILQIQRKIQKLQYYLHLSWNPYTLMFEPVCDVIKLWIFFANKNHKIAYPLWKRYIFELHCIIN
jgi:hypothetical protein